MRDLREQIRDYFDESGDPVTIEDVFFADAGDEKVRPIDTRRRPAGLRRPWIIAAGAALAVVFLVGLPVLFVGSTTPSTLPPVADPPTTTTQPEPDSTPSTTNGPDETAPTTVVPSSTTTTTVFVPEFEDAVDLDRNLESLVSDLIVAASDLGLPLPYSVDAGLDDENGSIQASVGGLGVAAYQTEEAASVAAAQLFAEHSEGQPITPVEAGDESYASYVPGGRAGAYATFVVRAGTWVFESGVRRPENPDEAYLEVEREIEAIIGAQGRGADLRVSKAWPVPVEAPDTYEHSWGTDAAVPAGTPGFEKDPESPEANPVFVARSYSLAVTAEGERCRFLETPFGAIEPQDYTEFFDDGSGVVSLSRRYVENDEMLDENADLASDDPRYLEARASCNRFEPLAGVRDLILASAPERSTDGQSEGASGSAYQTSDNAWVVVESRDEGMFDLDPSLLVVLGITDDTAPAGVEILSRSAFVDGDRYMSFDVAARGQRAALETAFGVDLSDLPDLVLQFNFTYEFQLEVDGPNQW